jgi:hypothetical protein
VLPYLTYGESQVIDILATYFLPSLDFNKYDLSQKDDIQTLHLECFTNVCESIGLDKNGSLLKAAMIEKGITSSLVNYLATNFPENQDQNSSSYGSYVVELLIRS